MIQEQESPDAPASEQLTESGSDVSSLPAGDTLPLPKWPLYATIILWALWIGFLMAMVAMRFKATGG